MSQIFVVIIVVIKRHIFKLLEQKMVATYGVLLVEAWWSCLNHHVTLRARGRALFSLLSDLLVMMMRGALKLLR